MSASAFAAQQVYKLHVDGLACPFCAYGVEKKLNTIKGVQGIGVEIASGTVTVTMAEEARRRQDIERELRYALEHEAFQLFYQPKVELGVKAHSLRIAACAHAETESQLEFLRRKGCHEAQGYIFGRPVPAAEFAA